MFRGFYCDVNKHIIVSTLDPYEAGGWRVSKYIKKDSMVGNKLKNIDCIYIFKMLHNLLFTVLNLNINLLTPYFFIMPKLLYRSKSN